MANNITHTRWADHLRGVAGLANEIADILDIRDDAARQACFATIAIDAGKHGVFVEPIPEAASPIKRGNEVVSEAAPRPRRVEPPKGEVVGENLGALKDPTPEQAEQGKREALMDGVQAACKALNLAGYTPAMTATRLNKYIKEKLDLDGGLGVISTDNDNLELLLKRLNETLDTFKSNKKGMDIDPGF